MCRWAAYIGASIYLSDILSAPNHSLIKQSKAADEGKARLNADGFGVAWYGELRVPGLFKDVHPAWSDANLKSISKQVKSSLFLAHVCASTGSAVSRNNCHPFTVENWSFMHNGLVGGFDLIRKKAEMLIPDALYHERKGATDSEAFFLRALGRGLAQDPKSAIAETILDFLRLATSSPRLRLAIAFSDGKRLYVARYASDNLAPSIYYSNYERDDSWAIVSEPFDQDERGWVKIRSNSFCIFDETGVKIEKLI